MPFLTRASPMSLLFPIFLVPPVPFRRRETSSSSCEYAVAASENRSDAQTTSIKGGYLTGHTSHLRCARCATDLCPTSQIISKGFTGRHGRAYLVSASPVTDATPHDYQPRNVRTLPLPNTRTHKAMPRQLVTGAHTVSDVSCAFCGSVIGWKYDSAEEETQRYKVGKYILETKKVFSSSCWENDHADEVDATHGCLRHREAQGSQDSTEFDSQDEDECEDLFAGGKAFFRPTSPQTCPTSEFRDTTYRSNAAPEICSLLRHLSAS
ncbi:MAG: hypothetical protein Q9166_004743 [cf. Caloplaca sp. 2 TL-2023]